MSGKILSDELTHGQKYELLFSNTLLDGWTTIVFFQLNEIKVSC